MSNEGELAARVDAALVRIEAARATLRERRGTAGAGAGADDGRYSALRARTETAIAELDGLIADLQGGER